VGRRTVLANFAFAKLAMVNDLDGALDELIAHDLIAALAGDKTGPWSDPRTGARPGRDPWPGSGAAG
jgi:hypothetical protein